MPFDEYAVDMVLEKKNFYKNLLKKYITWVGCMEGVTFIEENMLYPNTFMDNNGITFTNEEYTTLANLYSDIRKIYD